MKGRGPKRSTLTILVMCREALGCMREELLRADLFLVRPGGNLAGGVAPEGIGTEKRREARCGWSKRERGRMWEQQERVTTEFFRTGMEREKWPPEAGSWPSTHSQALVFSC